MPAIIKYDVLFSCNVRHTYYTEGRSEDFTLMPTASSRQLLQQYGLIFRETAGGVKVFAPVVPETDPPELLKPFDGASLKFTFMAALQNSRFDLLTALPDFSPARELFYFSNLYEDIDGEIRYLGDHPTAARVGNPITGITTPNLEYEFVNPVPEAQFTLTDMFGIGYTLPSAGFSYDEPVDSYRHNLAKVPGMKYGRYLMADNQGGSLPFYYDRDLYGREVFGVIEIFANTNGFTDPANDLVPESYRFVENDAISGKGNYSLGFSSAERKWMYVCRKNPANSGNGLSVANLTVNGPVPFSKAGGDDIEERRILSDNPIIVTEQPAGVELQHNGIKIRDLPVPSAHSRLAQQNNEVFYQMYIYV